MDPTKDFEQILRDHPDLLNELKTAQNEDDFVQAFSQYGIELSSDDIQELVSNAANALSKDELSDEDLEEISGGRIVLPGLKPLSFYALVKKIFQQYEKKSGSSGFGHTSGGRRA